MSNNTVTLGYWALPLRAQPIRYIFELAKFPYNQTLYTPSTASNWFAKDKQELALDFPNLPYLIKGDFKITESQNIINYAIDVTKQQNLQGNGQQKFRIDNIRYFCDELIGKVFLATRKTGEERATDINTVLIPKFKYLQKNLGNKIYFFDNKLTLADIYLYTATNVFKLKFAEEYKQFEETFDPFMKNFEQIPLIKEYHNSDRYPKMP